MISVSAHYRLSHHTFHNTCTDMKVNIRELFDWNVSNISKFKLTCQTQFSTLMGWDWNALDSDPAGWHLTHKAERPLRLHLCLTLLWPQNPQRSKASAADLSSNRLRKSAPSPGNGAILCRFPYGPGTGPLRSLSAHR